MFVDFGLDTGLFYDPEELFEDETKLQDKLYGDTGYVTLSYGDLETLFGHVVNYDAKFENNGTINLNKYKFISGKFILDTKTRRRLTNN